METEKKKEEEEKKKLKIAMVAEKRKQMRESLRAMWDRTYRTGVYRI